MSMRHAASLGAALILLALTSAGTSAHDVQAGTLTIKHPWARATPSGAGVAGGYVTIVNTGTAPDHLIGGSIEAASSFGLHQMAMDGGVMTMRPIGPLEIPAGGSVTLSPSAKHIMFTGLKHALKKGQAIDGTLVFEHAGTVPVRFDVEAIGARQPAEDGMSGHAMPGMDMN